jgi:pyrroloquinoline quinone biosynthesis protein E
VSPPRSNTSAGPSQSRSNTSAGPSQSRSNTSAPRPYTLIAELTYRCPLRCPYCSNPTDLANHGYAKELSTDEWTRVLGEAEALGVVQVHFTGGEPLARKDLEDLVTRARELELYSNLVTSGVPLTKVRLAGLKDRGLDHVQVSIQSARAERADVIAGYAAHPQKIEVMRWVRELGLPLTMNVVLHRQNLDEIDELVALAEDVGASRLELANTQYVAWALSNRDALLPTRQQLELAGDAAARHKARLQGRMDVLFVKPDYFGTTPKACMDGWARRFIHMVPDGRVLPCHAATSITQLRFDSVKDRPLADIWSNSEALLAYRGEAWMKEPCKSCDRRSIDFGGCRCQAFALTGDAAATDPACQLSPEHALVDQAKALAVAAGEGPKRYLYRGR